MNTTDLIRELAVDARPVRRVPSLPVRFALWLTAAALFSAAAMRLLGLRPDLSTKTMDAPFLLETAALLIFALWSAIDALQLSVPGSGARAWAPLIVAAAWIALLAHRFQQAYAADPQRAFAMDRAYFCSSAIIVIGVVPGFLMFALLRRAFPLERIRTGFLSGLANAAFAAFAMQFVCRHDAPLHLLTWHLLPIALSGAIGAASGAFLTLTFPRAPN